MNDAMSRVYVGIDPSATSTGVGILIENAASGPFTARIRPKMRGPARLVYIRDALNNYLIDLKPDIAIACIEGPALRATNRADTLGQVRGIVRLTVADLGVQELILPPSSLKKFAGHGSASKVYMVNAANKKWGLSLKESQNDEADALWLAQVAYALDTGKVSSRKQMEVIYGISNPKTKVTLKKFKNLNM